MKILQVNYADLMGKAFNGYDLQRTLNRKGITVKQAVLMKYSNDHHVISMKPDLVMHENFKHLEKKYSMSNLIFPYGKRLAKMECFQEADIVHYHIFYNGFLSILDLPFLMNQKKSVWTIHDPWLVTGNCVHPLDCMKWKYGCGSCGHLDYKGFEMHQDHTSLMWNLKRKVFSQIDPTIIVASEFSRNYIVQSPLTKHFTDIVKIPFGIEVQLAKREIIREMREDIKLSKDDFVIGFRAEEDPIKGCNLLYEALMQLEDKKHIILLTVGGGMVPQQLKSEYQVVEFGWEKDAEKVRAILALCDIFVMPSLAESFGVMALEALAEGTPVICFQGTVIEEVIHAPECGIAVPYKDIRNLRKAICEMRENRQAGERKGRAGIQRVREYFSYERYVDKHIQLYERLLHEDRRAT